MQHTECATCGRRLKDKKSIERGYGPVCYEKHLQALKDEEFEKNQMTIYDVIEGESHV
ncbi:MULTISPECIES: DUF6011 domain-containing protein [Virgibacillus]|uniref:DUF6011 domain-containing protein n=1 Tax=Virgibacillus TaxID=84406 RepID=UPI0013CECE98|nr:DUF6011 domain-containing protein [Virgibacillus sp. Bac332]